MFGGRVVSEDVGPRPLNSGDPFSLQVAVSCALSTREQMYSCFCVQYLQLLMSLMATMMAMITMSTTRMMSR